MHTHAVLPGHTMCADPRQLLLNVCVAIIDIHLIVAALLAGRLLVLLAGFVLAFRPRGFRCGTCCFLFPLLLHALLPPLHELSHGPITCFAAFAHEAVHRVADGVVQLDQLSCGGWFAGLRGGSGIALLDHGLDAGVGRDEGGG